MPPRYASRPFSMACSVQYRSRCHDAEARGGNWPAEMLPSAAERGGLVMMAEIAMLALHGKPDLPPEPRRNRAKAFRIL